MHGMRGGGDPHWANSNLGGMSMRGKTCYYRACLTKRHVVVPKLVLTGVDCRIYLSSNYRLINLLLR